jgi:uncharacterized protein (DUF2237 family)
MSNTNGNGHYPKPKNILGTELKVCCTSPMTGFYRDGYCRTGADDSGRHTVCILATDEFLEFSKAAGNDLSTPRPEYAFPGLSAGDKWCLVAVRWRQALEAGMAPQVDLEATHEATLEVVSLDDLKKYSHREVEE